MMSLYKQFSTDKNSETSGVWHTVGFDDDGKPIEFLIARAGGNNTRFQKLMNERSRAYNVRGTFTASNEVSERIARDVYAETIIKGWRNVINGEGIEVPFSVENCRQLLEDLPDLFLEIIRVASDMATFRAKQLEDDAKN